MAEIGIPVMSIEKELTVVIRSSSERTVNLCRQRVVSNGISEHQIHTVEEIPFSKAMISSYQIGVSEDRKWTYCLDADVLLRDGAISVLLEHAEQEKEELFGLSGKLLDKLFGRERSVGNHLFRTSHLPLMIRQFDTSAGNQIRPETEVKNRMRRLGYRWKKETSLLGLHDFEQHHHDIARKAFVHIHKHDEELSELIGYWREKQFTDTDFRVALYAASKSISHDQQIVIDNRLFDRIIKKTKKRYPIKSPLTELSGEEIEEIISSSQYRYQIPKSLIEKRRKDAKEYMDQNVIWRSGARLYSKFVRFSLFKREG